MDNENSKPFDKAAFIEANQGKDLHELLADLANDMRHNNETLSDACIQENTGEMLQAMREQLMNFVDIVNSGLTKFKDFQQSETYQSIKETVRFLIDNEDAINEWLNDFEQLKPFLEAEIKKPEYGGTAIDELLASGTDENGENIPGSLWEKAINAARSARERAQLPTATVKRAGVIEYPLDKVNARIWNLLEKDTEGQIVFAMEKSSSKKDINLYYSIDFDDLGGEVTITKRLTPFDKRVYIALSALFNAGNNVITLRQIYYAMGNTGRPSTPQLKKINDAITKMTKARISVDNSQEAEAYKYNKFVYDGSLLPLERGTAVVNGQLADAAIHIFREPPIISFAKKRKQITTVEIKLLQSPFNKTDANLLIDDYLIERISRMRNSKQSKRILFKTLYEKTGITTKKQKERAPEKITGYLDYYKQCGFIKSYSTDDDGITIRFR